ncbi:sigma-70 family RNA polymerase sigma factor [Paenibacillus lupini]|jgi:RNA polymerase sigma factor (sigma-70 family)|uniref:RNA polymerase sigma factor n=1 Tax=Paenibacillus lupini TaxID=1450204 RepID=UPI001ABADE92|nr:sigma-70 family RNA polymerase sigma factor [Paenibacillus lupini]NIK26806.1 RNA polymerase sigma factor (sigma-70 family) [Paenibacillus lupini]
MGKNNIFAEVQGRAVRPSSILSGREESEIQDEQWITAIKNGGPEAFQSFVDEYGPYLYRTVYAVIRSPHDAEDVTQEALLQIYRSLPEFRMDGLKTWITRIAVNKAIDWKRSRMRKPEELMESITGLEAEGIMTERGLPVEASVMEREEQRHVREQVEQLPDNYREVVTAYYMENKSYEEIAAQTGLEKKSVESRLYRARNWIKRHWRKEDFE